MKLNKNGTFYPYYVKKAELRPALQAVVEKTVDKLLSAEVSDKRSGLLLGKVQSGKTKAFMSAIALGFDNGVDIAVILTKGTLMLAEQTFVRLTDDFEDMIEGNLMIAQDAKNLEETINDLELSKKRVIVCMKEDDNLEKLIAFLTKSHPSIAAKSILVVDDEADAASIGYSIVDKKIKMKRIPELMDELRKKLGNAHFLQVTATPYSLYLQPEVIVVGGVKMMPVKPAFTCLVPIHDKHIGSEFYFDYDRSVDGIAQRLFVPVRKSHLSMLDKEDRRRVNTDAPLESVACRSLISAVTTFVAATCYRRGQPDLQGTEKYFSMLLHADQEKSAHTWQVKLLTAIKQALKTGIASGCPKCAEFIKESCAAIIDSAQASTPELVKAGLGAPTVPTQAELEKACRAAITGDWISLVKVNSEEQLRLICDPKKGKLRLKTPCTIFIGGQILDRGITIDNLLAFYYGRSPKKFQQNTVMQHSRMYGPRPLEDLAVTRFYTTNRVHQAMRQMHERDKALWAHVELNPDDVKFLFTDKNKHIVPCSPNQVLVSSTTTIEPGKRLLPFGFQVKRNNKLTPLVKNINKLIAALEPKEKAGHEEVVRVSCTTAKRLLKKIKETFVWDEEDADLEFDWSGCISLLEYVSNLEYLPERDRRSAGLVDIVIRRGRELSREVAETSHVRFNNAPYTKTENELVDKHKTQYPILFLIEQLGDKSTRTDKAGRRISETWHGGPFWWPVVWFPKSCKHMIYAQKGGDGEG